MAKPANKPQNMGPEALQRLLRGPRTAMLRESTTGKQFRKVKRVARRKGYHSVEDFLSGVPAALAPKPRRVVVKEAHRLINKSYKPMQKELSQQDKRLRALDRKRASDNAHYLTWLDERSQKLTTEAKAADDLLLRNKQGVQDELRETYDGMRQNLAESVGSSVGSVSSEANLEQAAKGEFIPEESRSAQRAAAVINSQANRADANQRSQATVNATNFAQIAAVEAKRASDTYSALKDVGDAKQKLKLQKAADSAKAVQEMLGQEIKKAESNRDFQAVMSKLDVDREELSAQMKRWAQEFGLKEEQLDLDREQMDLDEEYRRWAKQADIDIARASRQLGWFNARTSRWKAKNPGAGAHKKSIGSTNQYAFDNAFAGIATLTYTKTKQDKFSGKTTEKEVPANKHYVYENRNKVVSLLMLELKVNKKVAQAAVDAFISYGNDSDPGNYKRWLPGVNTRPPSG